MSLFQNLIKNQDINLVQTKKNTINRMIRLIKTQRTQNDINSKREFGDNDDIKVIKDKFINSLFSYFCGNSSLTWISIRNFEEIPLKLKQALC
eukprot:37964_1